MKPESSKSLLAGALALLAALSLPTSTAAPTVSAASVSSGESPAQASATPYTFDTLADLLVAQHVASKRISSAQAVLVREQLSFQFHALPADAQAALLSNLEGASGAMAAERFEQLLLHETQRAAREMLAGEPDVRGTGTDLEEAAATNKPKARLGPDGDYIFMPTIGPCRIADSRFFAAGALGANAARQIYAYSASGGYEWSNQGGTGTAGLDNCWPTEFISTPPPVAVVATVAVTNGTTSGSMRAWNGGTLLTVGGILGWTAGQTISNTTVISIDRSIPAYPGSGGKRDFALYNNSAGTVDYIVDVVGYFIQNRRTVLACFTQPSQGFSLPNGTSNTFSTPACPAMYEKVSAEPKTAAMNMWTGTVNTTGCRISNTSGSTQTVYCDVRCCQVPGR